MRRILFLTLLLCSCSQYGGVGTPGSPAWEMTSSPDQKAQFYADTEQRKINYCASIGAPKDSPNYFECRKWMQEQENLAAMQNAALAQQQQQQKLDNAKLDPSAFEIPTPQSTHCASYNAFGKIETDCRQY